MGNKYFRTPKITFAKQAMHLRHAYPENCCTIHKECLIWKGGIRPTPLSRIYKIRIECRGYYRRPKVILYGDTIDGIEKADFPHHFDIDRKKPEVVLCLHMLHEFDYSLLLADTIIPWTQEWLYYYEIWLATGEWCGGGHTPKSN